MTAVTPTVFDKRTNFAVSSVAIAPTPASTGPIIGILAGDGDLAFPTDNFVVVVWPVNMRPEHNNAEVARCTARAADNLTCVRAIESSVRRAIRSGDQIAAVLTAGWVGSIHDAINELQTQFNAHIAQTVGAHGIPDPTILATHQEFSFPTPALQWTIAHNLTRPPAAVTATLLDGTIVLPTRVDIDANTTQLTFSTLSAGHASVV